MRLATTILASLMASLARADSGEPKICFEFYRRDTMERWLIKDNSPFCMFNINSERQYEYGLLRDRLVYYVQFFDSTWHIVNHNKNYITEKDAGDHEYSISVYRPNLAFAHFLTITETDDASKIYYLESFGDDSPNNNVRTRLYVPKGSIMKKNLHIKKFMVGALVLINLVLVGFVVKNLKLEYGCMLNPFVLIGVSIISGLIEYHGFMLYFFIFTAVVLFGIFCAHLNDQKGYRSISFFCGSAMILYYFVTGDTSDRVMLFPAGLLIYFIAFKASETRSESSESEKRIYRTAFTIFWIQVYQFWSYIFVIYPGEQFVKLIRMQLDYKSGVYGTGLTLYYRSLISLVIVGTVAFLTSQFMELNRRKRFEYSQPNSEITHIPK